MGIELVTFKGQTVTPKDDALLQQYTLGQDGFFYGCAVTYTGGNTLHLSSGEGVICGREFKLDDTDLSAALPASGTLLGQVYAHIDLSNEDNPIQLIIETAAELTELTKDDDLNINNGEYDLQICTFTATTSALTDVESTVVYLVKGGGGGSMADTYDSSSPYVVGENFTKDGVYYEVIAPISAGDPLVIDTNVKVTNPGTQITAINQNLTQFVPIWNPTDDYYYVNGNRSIKAWLKSVNVWVNGSFGVACGNGVYYRNSQYSPTAYTVSGNNLTGTVNASQYKTATLVTEETIDFTNYNTVIVKTNRGNLSINVSNITGAFYLFFDLEPAGSTGEKLTVGLSTAKQNFRNYEVSGITGNTLQVNYTTLSITEIVVE